MLRMRSFQYVMDIIAALPLVYIARFLRMTLNEHAISMLSCNRLLKVPKVSLLISAEAFSLVK